MKRHQRLSPSPSRWPCGPVRRTRSEPKATAALPRRRSRELDPGRGAQPRHRRQRPGGGAVRRRPRTRAPAGRPACASMLRRRDGRPHGCRRACDPAMGRCREAEPRRRSLRRRLLAAQRRRRRPQAVGRARHRVHERALRQGRAAPGRRAAPVGAVPVHVRRDRRRTGPAPAGRPCHWSAGPAISDAGR